MDFISILIIVILAFIIFKVGRTAKKIATVILCLYIAYLVAHYMGWV